jgi:HK97 family phage major capsid protein
MDSGMPGDAIVLNPVDLAAISAMKNADGSYFVQRPSVDHPGPGLDQPIDALWGMRVVTSTTMNPGEFLVGAFQAGAAIYQREDLSVEVGYAENDFTENAVRILVEERLALAVWQTSAFVVGEF